MTARTQTRDLLFDLDGTLVDSLPGIEFSVDCALAECHLPERTRALRPLIGPPIRTIFSELTQADEPTLTHLEQAFRTSYDSTGWLKTVVAPDAPATLRILHNAGLRLFVVTNKPSAATRQILDWLGVWDLFVDVLCRDSRTPAFPSKADMLQHVLQAYCLKPDECLYLGDTTEDYGAAKQAGMPVAIVAYGYGAPDASYPQCLRLQNLSQLLTIVGTLELP